MKQTAITFKAKLKSFVQCENQMALCRALLLNKAQFLMFQLF